MSEEVTNLLLSMIKEQNEKIDNLDKKVDELIALKNRLIAWGIALSVVFGAIWDFVKNLLK